MKPLVSIIIPCYNSQHYVSKSIESALQQTYPHCEVIVVDDGSTDKSLLVIERYGSQIQWVTGPNQGGCAARNRGLKMAKGLFIQFLDADDYMENDKIEKQMKLILSSPTPHRTIATCRCRVFDENSSSSFPMTSHWVLDKKGVDFLISCWLTKIMPITHTWLTPMGLIEKTGTWDTSLVINQDGDFFSRVLLEADNVVLLDEEVVFYRRPSRGNVSQRKDAVTQASQFRVWEKVHQGILAKRDDVIARKAVVRTLRALALDCRWNSKITEKAFKWEKKFAVWDCDPTLPFLLRWMFGAFGIRRTFSIRNAFCRWFSKGRPLFGG